MSLLQVLPQTERALRDTLVARSALPQLDALAALYQLPRPSNIDDASWRAALRQVLFARRGVRGLLHAFLDDALTPQWGLSYQCTVAAAAPQTLTWVSGGADGGFTKKDVGRLFRVTTASGQGLYWSVGPAFNAGPAVSATLTLCYVGTAYWQPAKFTANGSATAVRLPFVWSDFGAQYYLAADTDAAVPPTYMQPQVRWQASSAGGNQGVQNTFWGTDGTDLPTWDEPAIPAILGGYTVTAQTAGTWRNLIFNADHDPNNPAAVPARGGTYDITLLKLVGGVYQPTALTCTLAADGKVASDTTHSVALVVGDNVQLYIAANNGVNKPVIFPKASVYIDHPAGEPAGGYILPDAAATPSVAEGAAGLAPLYLGGHLDEAFLLCLRRLLASGVILHGDVADFATKDSYW